ncbi:hypothetical protein FA13DRAFT_1721989 [Coprinellus micaceus]|uniref:Uncharacterized protein n=1 Tax=Coprinellus micaceus TaxID=71717 RepID=A0A4Y7RUN9_COPMI|nr:hypothetical protein FA13DRAFT_1721989 [Coprinellus micaceus]
MAKSNLPVALQAETKQYDPSDEANFPSAPLGAAWFTFYQCGELLPVKLGNITSLAGKPSLFGEQSRQGIIARGDPLTTDTPGYQDYSTGPHPGRAAHRHRTIRVYGCRDTATARSRLTVFVTEAVAVAPKRRPFASLLAARSLRHCCLLALGWGRECNFHFLVKNIVTMAGESACWRDCA